MNHTWDLPMVYQMIVGKRLWITCGRKQFRKGLNTYIEANNSYMGIPLVLPSH